MRFPSLSLSLIALFAAPAVAGSAGGGGGNIPAVCYPYPTMSQCQDSNYTGLCGNWSSTCSQMITDAFNQNAQSITTVRTALAPDSTYQAGNQVSTHYVPYDYEDASSTVRGASGGYFGAVMNHQAWALNPSSNGNLRRISRFFRYVDPEAAWQNDGTRSSSCEEYAYKRYLTASKFEDAIAGLGDDWMGILRTAFSTSFALGQQEIDDETGAYVMNWGWPAHAKNIYFELNIDQLPLTTFPWDSTLRSLLAAHPERTPSPDPFTLWNAINAQLAQYGEDKVELRYEEQKTFRKTLATRDGLWRDFQAFWQKNSCDTAVQPMRLACDWQHLITQGRLYNIDQSLQDQLWKGYGNACLWASPGSDPCAIGPHQLVDEMLASVDAAREPDYNECKRVTGNSFAAGSIVGVASAGALQSGTPSIPAGDYAATTASLKRLFGQIQQQFSNVTLPIDPNTHTYVLGSSAGDSATFGSGMFGAGYGYGAGWKIDFGTLGVVATANVHIWGNLSAFGTILGQNISVVDFANNVDSTGDCTNSTTITANTHFNLLGISLYSFSDSEPAQFNLTVGSQEKSGTLFSVPPIVIPLGPVPVTVNGGLSGGVGYAATLQGGLTRNCAAGNITASLGGGFTPFAHLDAFAQAGIGVPGLVEAGIRGTVTLARVDLPFTAGVQTTTNGALVTISGSANLDLQLTTFGGRIALFIDSFLYSTEMTLTSWPGKSFTQNLFHLDLGTLNLNAAAGKAGQPAS